MARNNTGGSSGNRRRSNSSGGKRTSSARSSKKSDARFSGGQERGKSSPTRRIRPADGEARSESFESRKPPYKSSPSRQDRPSSAAGKGKKWDNRGESRSEGTSKKSGTGRTKPFSSGKPRGFDSKGTDKRMNSYRDDSGEKRSFRSADRNSTGTERRGKGFGSGKSERWDNKGEASDRPKSRSGTGRSKPFSGGDSRSRDGRSTDKRKIPFRAEGKDKRDFRSSERDSGARPGRSKGFDKGESRSEKRPFKKKDGNGAAPGRFAGETQPDFNAPVQTGLMRLNRYISNSGVCSRREADDLITMGLISVNGKTITELGYKVNPGDEVRYENKVLRAEKPVYILLNKPKGYLTTTNDPQERKTVMQIIGHAVKERIYPVGRLDRNTTGLLLLTNDGDLADKLMHPSFNAKKIYKVELDKPLTKADFQRIQEGVSLEEGKAQVDDVAIISADNKTVGLEIHIGWNRVVRRIFESLGYTVEKLDRSVYAGLDKKDLPRGHFRFLTKEEVIRLKHY